MMTALTMLAEAGTAVTVVESTPLRVVVRARG